MTNIDFTEDGDIVVHRADSALHYHGDYVRACFITAAILMLTMQLTGSGLPMTQVTLIGFVAILVIAAGITNPVSRSIHWFNLLISFIGLAIFGSIAMSRLHSLRDLFTHDGLAGVIALVFLAALYLSTRTVRGILTGSNTLAHAND